MLLLSFLWNKVNRGRIRTESCWHRKEKVFVYVAQKCLAIKKKGKKKENPQKEGEKREIGSEEKRKEKKRKEPPSRWTRQRT